MEKQQSGSPQRGRATAFSRLFDVRLSPVPTAIVLALAACLLTATATLRGVEYDEGYTVFLAAGTPRPVWPDAPFQAGTMRAAFAGHSTLDSIATDLRAGDVHPPLYFWSVAGWRAIVGTSLLATRMFSVLLSLASLATIAFIARRCVIPPLPAMLLTTLAYGFCYTGAIARGFALTELLTLLGVAVLLSASRLNGAFAAGLLLGAATYANYLGVFVGVAALLWTALRRRSLAVPAILGFALVIPADLSFFATQHASRTGQFRPFELLPSLLRLGRYWAANLFGGLPLYAGASGPVIGALIALLLAALAALIVWHWKRIATGETRLLLLLAAAAPPLGLLLLGVIFDTTPIELRYLSFAVPFLALLIAGALATLPRPRAALGIILAIQALAIAGLLFRPETMQPQGDAARAAAAFAGDTGLVLAPYGNDGVGVLSAVVSASRDTTWIFGVRPGTTPDALRSIAAAYPRIVVLDLGLDANSRAVLPALDAAFPAACWRPAGSGANLAAFDRAC